MIWLILSFLGFGIFSLLIGLKISTTFYSTCLYNFLDEKPEVSLKEFAEYLEEAGHLNG